MTISQIGIFLHAMVGGGGGVTGSKELMGLVGEVTDDRDYTPPTPLSASLLNNIVC